MNMMIQLVFVVRKCLRKLNMNKCCIHCHFQGNCELNCQEKLHKCNNTLCECHPVAREIDRLKKEAGEIPTNTCPDIDKIINGLNDSEKSLSYYIKNGNKYDTGEELAEEINKDRSIDFDFSGELEKLRADNDKLRGLGIYWYEKCVELLEEYLTINEAK